MAAIESAPGAALNGKTCVVTGATSGIGRATALGLARLGGRVLLVCRDEQSARAAMDEIRLATGNEAVEFAIADLSSQQSVRGLASELGSRCSQLHVLVNNAAIVYSSRRLTVDGLEAMLATNLLAPFLLTSLLRDLLIQSAPARVVNLTARLHVGVDIPFEDLQGERRYRPFRRYRQTKLGMVLFTYELARRLQGTGLTANVVHPGVVWTRLLRDFRWARLGRLFAHFLSRSPEVAGRTPVYVASSPQLEGVSGRYFVDCRETRSSRRSYDELLARRLWDVCQHLTSTA